MRKPQRTITKSGGGRVGMKLVDETMAQAPASLTWREVWVLGVLAKEANDGTRLCWPGFEGESERSAAFRARTRCSRSQFYATVKALVDKGAIEITRRGQKGVQAVYRILPQGPGFPDTETDAQRPGSEDTETDGQGPGFQDTEEGVSVPVSESQGPGFEIQGPGSEDSGSRFDAFRVPETGTPSPQSPQISSSLSLALQHIHAAAIVAESEERDFATWIINTRKPGSAAWWRTVAANGDLPALAGAWYATRAKPGSTGAPLADVVARLDAKLEAPLPDAGGLAEYQQARPPKRTGAPATAAADPAPNPDADYQAARRTLAFVREHDPAALDRAFSQAGAELRELGIVNPRPRTIRAARLIEEWNALGHAGQEGTDP